jgi:hypothetical protein
MKTNTLLIPGLLLIWAAAQAADPAAAKTADRAASKAVDMASAFSRLKSLAGEWEAETQHGKHHISYEIVAGGTSLLEREWGDKMPVMLTLYHVDGDRLLLTHYCMAGNQPRMKAERYDASAGELEFRFLDATNLGNPNAGHMRNVKVQFLDDRHFSSEWQFFENGKQKFAETARYTRVR